MRCEEAGLPVACARSQPALVFAPFVCHWRAEYPAVDIGPGTQYRQTRMCCMVNHHRVCANVRSAVVKVQRPSFSPSTQHEVLSWDLGAQATLERANRTSPSSSIRVSSPTTMLLVAVCCVLSTTTQERSIERLRSANSILGGIATRAASRGEHACPCALP